MYPDNYLYTKNHEWIAVEESIGTVGITDHAQHELGDIVYLELPEAGQRFDANDVLGTVESVKAVSEIYCPVSGEVVEVNGALTEHPETINSEPHGAAWMVKLKLSNPDELGALMSSTDYQKFVSAGGH
ncbi:MAG TPA: glycine cleavage system protein GcvH [Acidobacteriota bacterium]|jgi:glycine cleavage system H protein